MITRRLVQSTGRLSLFRGAKDTKVTDDDKPFIGPDHIGSRFLLNFQHHVNIGQRHEDPNKRFGLNHFLKTLSVSNGRRLIKYLNKEGEMLDNEREVSSQYRPPQIHENGVFLYQSEKRGSSLRTARFAEIPIFVASLLALPTPTYTIMFWFVNWFAFLRAKHFEVANRLVVRMDLLPHLEMVAFQKVGPFGCLKTVLVKIENLEKINSEFNNENYFWHMNPELDRDLIFRDKSTGEQFLFESDGVWNWEGISHKLLN